MHIDIHCRGFDLTESLRDHAERRLAFGLSHGQAHVRRVIVRLSDINGPKGGEDKRCHIEVKLFGKDTLVVEDTQEDMYVAVTRASERLGRTLSRRLAQDNRAVRHASTEILYE